MQVIFVAAGQPIPDTAPVKRRVGARRAVIKAALEYLTSAPELGAVYGKCQISTENLAKFPEDGVPAPLMKALISSDDLAGARRDTAGYAPQDLSDDDSDDDEENSVIDTAESSIITQVGGVVDVEASKVTIDDLQKAADAKAQTAPEEALILPVGPKIVNDYTAEMWIGAF